MGKKNVLITIIVIVMVLVTVYVLAGLAGFDIFNLMADEADDVTVTEIVEVEQESIEDISSDETMEETTIEETTVEEDSVPQDLNMALGLFNYNNEDSFAPIKAFAQEQFGDDFLAHQEEIMELLLDKNLMHYNFGYAFLPDHPMEHTEGSPTAVQIDVPLILQSDPRWARRKYGTAEEDTVRLGGCAVVSLSMIEAAYGDSNTTPDDIIDWSGNDYWVGDDGTSWQIFPAFAEEYGYEVIEHGNDLYAALEEVRAGNIVIASVNPGHITTVGHILVIRGHDPEQELVFVNDPNDTPENMYSIQGIPEYIFIEDGVNYWSFHQ